MLKRFCFIIWFVIMAGMTFAIQLEIGNGNDNSQHLPCDPFYRHSASQLIYSSSYFNQACTINQLAFQYSLTSPNPELYINDVLIMIGESSQASFADETDYLELSDLDVCFEGNLTPFNFHASNSEGDGWMVITLTQAYYYSATENLIIFFMENDSDQGMNSDDFIAFDTANNTSMCFVDNVNPLDSNNLVPAIFVRSKLPNSIFDITPDANYPQIIYPPANASQILPTSALNIQVIDPQAMTIHLQANSYTNQLVVADCQMIDENIYEVTPLLPFAPASYYSLYASYFNGEETFTSQVSTFATIEEGMNLEISSSQVNNSSVNLEWTNLFNNNYPYLLYRNGQLLAEVNVNSFVDSNIEVGETYYYKVKFIFCDESFIESPSVQVLVNEPANILLDDDFEEYPAFTSQIGDWQSIDNDGQETYVIADYQYPNQGNPAGFMIFQPSATNPPLDFNIAGDKCLVSFSAISPPTSDILISPSFQAQQVTITINAKSLNTSWGMERIKVGLIYNNNEEDIVYLNQGNYLEVPEEMSIFTFDHNVNNNQDIITNLLLESCGIQTLLLIIDRILITSSATSNDNNVAYLVEPLIYPNPVINNEININKTLGLKKVKIYNLRGQLVHSSNFNQNRSRIDLPENISNGIYLVKFIYEGQEKVQKISIIKTK